MLVLELQWRSMGRAPCQLNWVKNSSENWDWFLFWATSLEDKRWLLKRTQYPTAISLLEKCPRETCRTWKNVLDIELRDFPGCIIQAWDRHRLQILQKLETFLGKKIKGPFLLGKYVPLKTKLTNWNINKTYPVQSMKSTLSPILAFMNWRTESMRLRDESHR